MARLIISCRWYCLLLWMACLGADGMALAQTQASAEATPRAPRKITLKARSADAEMSLDEIRVELKKVPADAVLYYRAGFLEEQRGNLVQALRDYQEAINMKARLADAYYRSGVVWEKTGEFYDLRSTDNKGRVINGEQRQRAIDSYRAAIRVRPDFADAYYRLSLVYLLGDDMREANESYQKLHQLEPDTDRTRQLLLMIYKRHQQQSRTKK
jgi:tetratricopeptide (TPR) repeat protein